jgi:hypothetical protein
MAGFEVSTNGRLCPVHRGFCLATPGSSLLVFDRCASEYRLFDRHFRQREFSRSLQRFRTMLEFVEHTFDLAEKIAVKLLVRRNAFTTIRSRKSDGPS